MPDWLNDAIQRAQEDGQFDDLPGKGKPLDLSKNPYEDPTWSVAHRMIRQQGSTLPWIAERQTLIVDIDKARDKLTHAWSHFKPKGPQTPGWQRAIQEFEAALDELNQRIRDFNLKAPTANVHLQHLNCEQEIRRITQP